MANPIDAAGDVVSSGRGMLSTIWGATRGVLAAAAISTAIAASTGGLSLTADAAMAAGESVKLTPMDMISNVGQGFVHNVQGLGDILGGWMESAPAPQ